MANGDGDKRKVTTDALETLGTIIDNTQKRDAIHLAVEPVIAGQVLGPGQHIRVENGTAYRSLEGQGQGIVDPFLPRKVQKGEHFWFVMYPRMVHSLRHVWTHPDFPDEVGTSSKPTKEASKKWIEHFLATTDAPSYDIVMELIDKGTLSTDSPEYYDTGGRYDESYLHFSGSDAHGEIPAEFWVHAENVLGRTLDKRPSYFSCSC